jgi:hypothetical protein
MDNFRSYFKPVLEIFRKGLSDHEDTHHSYNWLFRLRKNNPYSSAITKYRKGKE